MSVTCAYCNKLALFVTGAIVYPHRPDLYCLPFYYCEPCQAWVGCHPGTAVPLGRLANLELRRAKRAAHAAFDPIWQNGGMSRSKAYTWLASRMKIKPQDCHIGMFDVDTCLRVVQACGGVARKGLFDDVFTATD